jgi:hypothetical protein
MAKRARELAVKEKRERKRAKKAARLDAANNDVHGEGLGPEAADADPAAGDPVAPPS